MDLRERREGVRHPWEVARARFFFGVLSDRGFLSRSMRVLDAGAGDAWFARELVRRSPGVDVDCWDIGYADHELGARDGVRFVREKPAGRYDLALLLDVLEHVDDDREFVRGIVEDSLQPGAHALVSVPCWPGLFSDHDRALRHHRRYRPPEIRALLETSGLRVEVGGGLFHSLLVPRAAAVLAERARGGGHPEGADATATWNAGRFVTSAVEGALSLDGRLSRVLAAKGVDVPGLSWWALARRTG